MGHVDDVGLAHGFEQLAGHVIGRRGPGRGIVELARLLLGRGEEVGAALDVGQDLRVDDEHVRHVDEKRDVLEILHHVKG